MANLSACHRDPRCHFLNFLLFLSLFAEIYENIYFLRWWSHPDEFYPQHFLKEGKVVSHTMVKWKWNNIKPPFQVIENKEGFLPYSTGKRACPGAKLADMQLFLVLTNILAEYTLSLPKGDKGELGTQFKVKQRQQCKKQTLQPCHSGWHSCAEEPETVQSGRPGEGLTQFRFPLWLLPRERQQSIAPYLKVSHFPFYRYLNKILVLKQVWYKVESGCGAGEKWEFMIFRITWMKPWFVVTTTKSS